MFEKENPALIEFDKIAEDYKAKGIDLTDINGVYKPTLGHYDKWLKTSGISKKDADADMQGTFAKYQADPQGEAAKPLYVDVWHYLLAISDVIPWTTDANEHKKVMPITESFLTVRADIDAKEMQLLNKRQETSEAMPPEFFKAYIENRRTLFLQQTAARQVMLDILADYGSPLKGYGNTIYIIMRVSR